MIDRSRWRSSRDRRSNAEYPTGCTRLDALTEPLTPEQWQLVLSVDALCWKEALAVRRRWGCRRHPDTLEELHSHFRAYAIAAAVRFDPSLGYQFMTLVHWYMVAGRGVLSPKAFPWRDPYRPLLALQEPMPGYVNDRGIPVTLEAYLAFDPARPVEDVAADADEYEAMLAGLRPRDREAVVRNLIRGETLAECGKALGITKERVRQLIIKAVHRLRYPALRTASAAPAKSRAA